MSLGIFSYDLLAWLDRVADTFGTAAEVEPPPVPTVSGPPAKPDLAPSTDAMADLFVELAKKFDEESNITRVDVKIEPTSSGDMAETVGAGVDTPTSKPPVGNVTRPKMSDLERLEFERMVRSLQTSTIHNYRDADIAGADFSRQLAHDLTKREARDESNETTRQRDELKRDQRAAERRAELIRRLEERR